MDRDREDSVNSPQVRCPRCGYDQRGVAATWTEACPLGGTCSECGLAFAWADLFDHVRSMPDWCVESSAHGGSLGWKSILTTAMLLRPWRFWSDLRMVHPFMWRRVVLLLLAVILVIYVLFAASVGYQAWAHAAQLRGMGAIPVSGSELESALLAALLPFSDEPCLKYSMPTTRGMLVWPPSVFTAAWYSMKSAFPVVLLIQACSVAAFLALPVTRRRAKVRFVHIVRVATYGLILWVPAAVVLILEFALVYARLPILANYMVLATLGWLLLWWSCAVRHYLRMPHAWGIAIAVMIMAVLSAAAIWYYAGQLLQGRNPF